MKMARASKADLDAALDVSNIIEQLEQGYMPSTDESDELERFDSDDREQCKRALSAILDAAAKGSLFRVTFGMTVVLDPRNELLDPAADSLELHPRLTAALDRPEISKHEADGLEIIAGWMDKDGLTAPAALLRQIAARSSQSSADQQINPEPIKGGD